jgi:hypothetical protein
MGSEAEKPREPNRTPACARILWPFEPDWLRPLESSRMQPAFRILVIAAFVGILVSLGSALYQLTRKGGGDSKKMIRALAIRVGLSVALFLALMIAWYLGLISPHGLPVQANP